MKLHLQIPLLLLALCSCASTRIETTGSALPRCSADGKPAQAHVFWKTEWRSNQKDVEQREEAVLRAIEDFFRQPGCFSAVAISRLDSSDTAAAQDQALASAAAKTKSERIILITVHELGPVVRLCASPALVEGGTEALIGVRVLEPQGAVLADCRIHWQNGGPFAIKNTRTLREDMKSPLRAALGREQ